MDENYPKSVGTVSRSIKDAAGGANAVRDAVKA